jgi:transposase InsO family protein
MLVGEPMERLAIDITGPHPKSSAGHVYILTVLDPFTKWAEAVPLRNHEATTVARALTDQVFNRIGIPMQILSDRGAEFEGHLMQELCRCLEIEKIRTTSYKPSTNGGVERFHRTLNSMLAKVVETNQRDWSTRLPQVMAAYRASQHEATGYSPNFLVYGRELRAPVDIVFGPPQEEVDSPCSYDEFVDDRICKMRESYEIVRNNLGNSLKKAKKYYDVKTRPTTLAPGVWVWHYCPRRYIQRSPKWQKLYDGPYLVIRKVNEVNYVLQKNKKSAAFITHVDKLKVCGDQNRVSWLSLPESEDTDSVVAAPISKPKDCRYPARVLDEVDEEERLVRPRRQVGRPSRFDDYV